MTEPRLSHTDAEGTARMVDVGAKDVTQRRAVATAQVRMKPETATLVVEKKTPKGDVIGTARIAGIQGGKRTSDLIPLCHPLPLSFLDVEIEVDPASGVATITAEARTTAQTGVEMEALTACSVAALTVYDMVKGVERGVEISGVRLLEKSGGKSDYSAQRA